jgi:hypothetical protein
MKTTDLGAESLLCEQCATQATVLCVLYMNVLAYYPNIFEGIADPII